MNFQKLLTPFINFNLVEPKKTKAPFDGFIYLFSAESYKKFKMTVSPVIEMHSPAVGKKQILENEQKFIHFNGVFGPVWIIFLSSPASLKNLGSALESSASLVKDLAFQLQQQLKSTKVQMLSIDATALSPAEIESFIVGLELSAYNYLNVYQGKDKNALNVALKTKAGFGQLQLEKALKLSQALNISRHLINLPPNHLNPTSYEQIIKKQLSFSKSTTIEVWDYEKCLKENMNLLCAVGQGAKHKPKMIRLKYRPAGSSKKQPVAFVGKGITFDTGGLDIKPSSAMRLMKKDMGGSAAVVGLAYWVDQTKYNRPCDFYLALAENAVDAEAMRPSDVYKSRAGFDVEIDNTDAEGRLVLADVMNVAVTQKEKPEYLIDVATLTGAIKVALGADMAGLFCNDDQLSEQIFKAGVAVGEPNWRMPLFKKYFTGLNSQFADFRNSADGFGGAITAALFLEKFAADVKWAHLDVYCWTDKNQSGLTAGGANPQPVQTLVEWLKHLK